MYINNPGHMTRMAARPIYGKKNFKNLLLRNQWTDFYETWLEASMYIYVYINHDPVMTLTQFMARSTWVANALEWE